MPPTTPITPPPGSYVEVGVADIDEGKFLAFMNAQLRKAFRDWREYEEQTQDMTAKAVISPKITLQRMKGSQELIEITYTIPVKIPVATRLGTAKERAGKLLCQPSGTNEGHPDQQLFYDSRGQIIAGVDTETGEDHGAPSSLKLPNAANGGPAGSFAAQHRQAAEQA